MQGSDLGVELDETSECSLVEGDGPPLWEVKFEAKLTILVGLVGFAPFVNLGFVLAKRKVEVGSIRGEGGVYGAPRTSRAEILWVPNEYLAPIWMF